MIILHINSFPYYFCWITNYDAMRGDIFGNHPPPCQRLTSLQYVHLAELET